MLTKIKLVVAAALMLGAGSLAQASESDGGNETGGYVLPGSMVGVNPVYHQSLFPQYAVVRRAYGRGNTAIHSGAGAYAFAPLASQE
jgi:hypothetical protein